MNATTVLYPSNKDTGVGLSCVSDAQIPNFAHWDKSEFVPISKYQLGDNRTFIFLHAWRSKIILFILTHDAQRCWNNASAMPKLQCLLPRLLQFCFNLVPFSLLPYLKNPPPSAAQTHCARRDGKTRSGLWALKGLKNHRFDEATLSTLRANSAQSRAEVYTW